MADRPINPTEYYQLVNTLLYTAHEKLPKQLIPTDEHLTTDKRYATEIRNIVNRITGFLSGYSPQFTFQMSPFDKNRIVPAVPMFECSKMYVRRKSFDLAQVLKAFEVK